MRVCPSTRSNSFTACLLQSIHLLPGMSPIAICNMQSEAHISKSSITALHPCAVLNPFFSLSIRASAYSRGKSKSLLSPLLLFTSQNNTCASGDSHQLWLAIALAASCIRRYVCRRFVRYESWWCPILIFLFRLHIRRLKQATHFISS